jgi:alkylhydroperoxidase family enzyme
MAWIRQIDESEAEGELKELYGRYRDPESGRMDHIGTIHSLHPAGLRTHFELYGAVMRGTRTLPRVDRELIAVVVSQLNRCHY